MDVVAVDMLVLNNHTTLAKILLIARADGTHNENELRPSTSRSAEHRQ